LLPGSVGLGVRDRSETQRAIDQALDPDETAPFELTPV
jgi:hypothetical protein